MLIVCVCGAVACPQNVQAHGELLIRIAKLTQQIEAAPTPTAELYLQRGELYREDLNWAAAEADYDRAASLDSSLIVIDYCRARMLAESGRLEAAKEKYSVVLERDPLHGEALVGRARVLGKLGQGQAAIGEFKRGLELLPQPAPEYFVELARLFIGQNQPNEALATLDWGLQKIGPGLTLLVPALDLEVAGKSYESALRRVDLILQIAHRKEAWLARRGDVLLLAGRKAEARDAYNQALSAIQALPRLIQQGPAMLKLQSHVHAALAGINNASMASR